MGRLVWFLMLGGAIGAAVGSASDVGLRFSLMVGASLGGLFWLVHGRRSDFFGGTGDGSSDEGEGGDGD